MDGPIRAAHPRVTKMLEATFKHPLCAQVFRVSGLRWDVLACSVSVLSWHHLAPKAPGAGGEWAAVGWAACEHPAALLHGQNVRVVGCPPACTSTQPRSLARQSPAPSLCSGASMAPPPNRTTLNEGSGPALARCGLHQLPPSHTLYAAPHCPPALWRYKRGCRGASTTSPFVLTQSLQLAQHTHTHMYAHIGTHTHKDTQTHACMHRHTDTHVLTHTSALATTLSHAVHAAPPLPLRRRVRPWRRPPSAPHSTRAQGLPGGLGPTPCLP